MGWWDLSALKTIWYAYSGNLVLYNPLNLGLRILCHRFAYQRKIHSPRPVDFCRREWFTILTGDRQRHTFCMDIRNGAGRIVLAPEQMRLNAKCFEADVGEPPTNRENHGWTPKLKAMKFSISARESCSFSRPAHGSTTLNVCLHSTHTNIQIRHFPCFHGCWWCRLWRIENEIIVQNSCSSSSFQ